MKLKNRKKFNKNKIVKKQNKNDYKKKNKLMKLKIRKKFNKKTIVIKKNNKLRRLIKISRFQISKDTERVCYRPFFEAQSKKLM